MATTEVFHNGDGSDVTFNIPFEYLEESDVKVSVGGVLKTQDTDYTFSTLTEITFTTAPPSGTNNVRIFRDTDIESLRNEFFAGSAIRAQDLNDDFLQTLYTVQEIEDQFVTQSNGSFDTNVDMNSNRITELADPVDAQDAVTKQYLEDNYFDDGTETITSGETWASNDTTIATTQSIDNRVDSKIDTAITSDIGTDGTGVTVTDDGDGTITLGLGAGSIDLDRIKAADIIVSGETNPNNDITIATTAKIDDMIDAAITGDIAVDSTGLTVTDDGDGTITLGIGSGSVDLDRIKPGDIITYAEQNAGPTTDDDSIFTSSAASRRFDTLVQTGTPTGSDWETGKTWLQNDDDQTLKVWNGSAWLDVASGGSFRTQDRVIYVDSTGGDNTKTGHRISGPKLTIKAAIEDINADVDTSIESAGSGYTDGSYTNVPLTGGTSGSGLQANITVASGAVTACTVTDTTTLEDYQIGDILSAADSNLGGGGGSGFQLKVTGNGDGMTVIVAAGDYEEAAPIQIKRRNVSIIGMALRSTIVHPSTATQGDHADGNNALFELNSGSFIQNLTLTGMQAGTYSAGDPNTLDSDLPKRQGWNFAFYDNCVITKSPYIQNCTNFSDSQIVNNSDFDAHNPAGGQGGDLTNAPTGGGLLVDGSVPNSASPLRSMVCDSYTHVGLNGPGILVTKNGYLQATSSYAFFNKYHIKALDGGQANLAASTTDFGEKALVADGKSTSAIFTSNVDGAASASAITFNVNQPTAGTGWFGDTQRPAQNMVVEVTNTDATTSIYPILSATANTDSEGGAGWTVTISNPNSSNRSTNDGLDKALDDDAAVSFYLRSQIASSGHTMEYVGSGMDYDALPENGGVPDETKQITELNNGKIWTAITDHNGKFKIGGNQTDDPFFTVDQQLGFVTIPEGSIAFNLLSDTTPQLGGDLDVNDFKITSAGDGNVHIGPHGTGKIRVDAAIITASDNNITLDPHGTGQVDVSSHKIINLADPTSAQDAATKSYVDTQIGGIDEVVEDLTPQLGGNLDVNGQTITSASNGNVVIDPDGTGNIQLNSNVGIGTSSPDVKTAIVGSALTKSWSADTNDFLVVENDSTATVDIRSGSTAGGNIIFSDGDARQRGRINYDHSTDELRFGTAGVNSRVAIDSSGRVGIGAAPSTSSALMLTNSSYPSLQMTYGGSNALHRIDWDSAGLVIKADAGNAVANSKISFEIDGGEKLKIDSSGNVGIGLTPTAKLHVAGTIQSSVGSHTAQMYSDGGAAFFTSVGAYPMVFYTNSSERLRIDSSGRLLVGPNTARSNFFNSTFSPRFQLEGPSDTARIASIVSNNVSGAGGVLVLASEKSGSVGGNTAVSDNGQLGLVSFQGNDGSDFVEAVRIEAQVDGTPGANDMPGRLVFSTTDDGASNPTERVRIESNGRTKFSGGVYGVENTITTGTGGMDLNDGNFWTCAGITIPLPTNGVAGMSGLIRVTAAPTFATGWDFPGGSYTAPTAFPAIAPFYIVNSSTFLLGSWTEGIA